MGLDLTLHFPVVHDKEQTAFGQSNRLYLDRRYQLFDQIRNRRYTEGTITVCRPKLVGERFDCSLKTDHYGDPLTYVTADELKRVNVRGESQWNQAIWAMIAKLPDSTPVILYWH